MGCKFWWSTSKYAFLLGFLHVEPKIGAENFADIMTFSGKNG